MNFLTNERRDERANSFAFRLRAMNRAAARALLALLFSLFFFNQTASAQHNRNPHEPRFSVDPLGIFSDPSAALKNTIIAGNSLIGDASPRPNTLAAAGAPTTPLNVSPDADEIVCYSFHNEQGWTANTSGLPPSIASSGSIYSRWRFDLSCNRVNGICLPFGNGSRVFLDFDGPNGPLAEYEQVQFYYDIANPSATPRVVTTIDSFGIVTSTYYFSLRYATTAERFAVNLVLEWQETNPSRPGPGYNAPTIDEFRGADVASWSNYNHFINDDPTPALCLSGGVRANPPIGPVWTNPNQPRCGTPSGLPPCCVGELGNGFSIGTTPTQVVQITPIACPMPTAASVSIGGRVTTPEGRGLRGALVSLTDQNGNTRTAMTTTFGYYHFDEVAAGETYVISVSSKRYSFAPQVVSVMEDLTGLNFTAEPRGKWSDDVP